MRHYFCGFIAALLIALTSSAQTSMMLGYGKTLRTGRVFLTQFGNAIDWGEGLVATSDAAGRIYLAGTADFGAFAPTSGFTSSAKFKWYVLRLRPDLIVDTSFGSGGIVTLDFGNQDMELTSILIDPAGRILCGGIDYNIQPTKAFHVARFNPDGSLDATFGAYGIATTGPTATSYYADRCLIALQSTGKIVVVGQDNTSSSVRYAKLWRFNPNGSRDLSFGSPGQVTYGYQVGGMADSPPFCVVVDASDRVYIGGTANTSLAGGPHWLAYVARFTSAGYNDPSWGVDSGGGTWAVTFDGPQAKSCLFTSLLLEAGTGKIIAAGDANSDSTHTGALVARFTTSGALDTTFATNGYTIANFGLQGNDSIDWASFDSSGRIVAAGQTSNASGSYYLPTTRFSVYRFTPAGAVDSTFGVNGAVTPVPPGDNQRDSVFYGAGSFAVIRPDGSLILPGHVNSDTGHSVGCLVALKADGSINTGVGDPVSAPVVTNPLVSTGAATSIGPTSATLNETVTPQSEGITHVAFEYGLTSGLYPYRVQVAPGQSSAQIGGLLSGYTYHYRATATTIVGETTRTAYGADATFTTTSGSVNTLFLDTFTDSNGSQLANHTPDINMTGGGLWIDQSGSGSISGNKVVSAGDYIATVTTGVLDCTVQGDFTWNGTGIKQPSIMLRWTNVSNYWEVYADGTNFKIIERIGGFSTIRATSPQTLSANTIYTIRVVVSGSTITATINGGNSITYGSMTSLTGSKNAGFELYQSGVTLDNFSVTAP